MNAIPAVQFPRGKTRPRAADGVGALFWAHYIQRYIAVCHFFVTSRVVRVTPDESTTCLGL